MIVRWFSRTTYNGGQNFPSSYYGNHNDNNDNDKKNGNKATNQGTS